MNARHNVPYEAPSPDATEALARDLADRLRVTGPLPPLGQLVEQAIVRAHIDALRWAAQLEGQDLASVADRIAAGQVTVPFPYDP